MSFNFGSLFSGLQTALSSGNVVSALTAATNLQAALGTSTATVTQAQMYLTNYQVAQAKSPPDMMGMAMAVQGLTGMTNALPTGDAPLVQELGQLMTSAPQAADVIARIQASLIQHNFL